MMRCFTVLETQEVIVLGNIERLQYYRREMKIRALEDMEGHRCCVYCISRQVWRELPKRLRRQYR